ncbi:MAG: double-strand break repair protein AddB, partial [Paracoccaceae bacterium]
MFDGPAPRLFGLPPGADFPKELLAGLEQRLSGQAPEAWAKVEIYVNTQRMRRRLVGLFDAGPPRLMPRIRLVTELGAIDALPPAVPPLRRRLELSRLVATLLEQQPDLAPSAALFDLADSLAALMDEMQGEGVPPEVLHDLDVSHLSAHWDRTRRFLGIVERFFGAAGRDTLDAEARRRLAVERLAERWASAPPDHPVIVAGSTGSRGATALFMEAVARLPQGAVVLPGFDFDQPAHVWDSMDDAMTAEDHPQYRFRRLTEALGLTPRDVRAWSAGTAPNPDRNRLVSLALRPAPVTDHWLDEGPALTGLAAATGNVALVEAPSPRAEALAIA